MHRHSATPFHREVSNWRLPSSVTGEKIPNFATQSVKKLVTNSTGVISGYRHSTGDWLLRCFNLPVWQPSNRHIDFSPVGGGYIKTRCTCRNTSCSGTCDNVQKEGILKWVWHRFWEMRGFLVLTLELQWGHHNLSRKKKKFPQF